MIRNIITLTLNDLAIACKNKTVYLVLFIPLFVFVSLNLVDQKDGAVKQVRLGLIGQEHYSPVIIESIEAADAVFAVSWLADETEGRAWLKEKKIDGLLLRSEQDPQRVELLVPTRASFQTLAIVEGLSAMQLASDGESGNWISAIKPLQNVAVQKQALPTWVLMLVLLVSCIIIPGQVAEEKEKKLLLGLLQTPMRESEWLLAKLASGMILIYLAVLFLHLLGSYDPGNLLSYGAFIGVGSFCFCSFGILLGFLCRSQASARTLGIIFYLPLLLPSALADVSQKLNRVAPFLPSYQFYGPVNAILLEGGSVENFSPELAYLLFVGIAALSAAYRLMKERWLM
jgi:ABC-2 type transport system permease protein